MTLPGPFPELGEIWVEGIAASANEENQEKVAVVCIRTSQDPSWCIERRVLRTNVAAAWLPGTEAGAQTVLLSKDIYVGSDLDRQLGDRDHPRPGLVYVAENAPVLMTVEYGTTASDSAEYQVHGVRGSCDCGGGRSR